MNDKEFIEKEFEKLVNYLQQTVIKPLIRKKAQFKADKGHEMAETDFLIAGGYDSESPDAPQLRNKVFESVFEFIELINEAGAGSFIYEICFTDGIVTIGVRNF